MSVSLYNSLNIKLKTKSSPSQEETFLTLIWRFLSEYSFSMNMKLNFLPLESNLRTRGQSPTILSFDSFWFYILLLQAVWYDISLTYNQENVRKISPLWNDVLPMLMLIRTLTTTDLKVKSTPERIQYKQFKNVPQIPYLLWNLLEIQRFKSINCNKSFFTSGFCS